MCKKYFLCYLLLIVSFPAVAVEGLSEKEDSFIIATLEKETFTLEDLLSYIEFEYPSLLGV